jgi:membrane protein required for colicin V production
MIDASFTYFDLAVIGILALSCLFAFFRGFVREILSLGAWIGAGLVTIYYFPHVARLLEPRFKSPMVAAGIATLTLYIVALLLFSMLNALILRFVKEGSDVGFLDNSLGLLFGAFRGVFIVSLAYLLLTMGLQEDTYPKWLKTARTRPYVEKGAVILARAAPDYLRELSSLRDKATESARSSMARKQQEEKEDREQLERHAPEPTYSRDSSEDMQRFMQRIQPAR